MSKELINKLKTSNIYLTSRGEVEKLNDIIKNDVRSSGSKMENKADMVNFHKMEVTNNDSILNFRNLVESEQGKIDILINNAGQYFAPSDDPEEHMQQVEQTLATNYWGMKNVCKAFLPMMNPAARIVNLSSHLGHLSMIPGAKLQSQLGDKYLTEDALDSLMNEYEEHCRVAKNDFSEAGWPACAYSVSKVESCNEDSSKILEEGFVKNLFLVKNLYQLSTTLSLDPVSISPT